MNNATTPVSMNNETNTALETLGSLIAEAVAFEAMRAAQLNEHKGIMSSSARLAACDASACYNRGEFGFAYDRARESLSYSLGCFAPEVQSRPKRTGR